MTVSPEPIDRLPAMPPYESPVTPRLLEIIRAQFRLDWRGIHGASHWARVRANGLALASRTGAKQRVIEAFAVLHDSERIDDDHDPGHGPRAATFAIQLWLAGVLRLAEQELDLLVRACLGHSEGGLLEDATVQTCWDADRLDLGRVGIRPDPARLCTAAARDPQLIEAAYDRSIRWRMGLDEVGRPIPRSSACIRGARTRDFDDHLECADDACLCACHSWASRVDWYRPMQSVEMVAPPGKTVPVWRFESEIGEGPFSRGELVWHPNPDIGDINRSPFNSLRAERVWGPERLLRLGAFGWETWAGRKTVETQHGTWTIPPRLSICRDWRYGFNDPERQIPVYLPADEQHYIERAGFRLVRREASVVLASPYECIFKVADGGDGEAARVRWQAAGDRGWRAAIGAGDA